MTTINLGTVGGSGTSTQPDVATEEQAPFRVAVTLPELQFLADAVGLGLPFVAHDRVPTTMEARLGGTLNRGSGGPERDLAGVLQALPDPRVSLTERGLISPSADKGLAAESGEDTQVSDASIEIAPAILRILALLAVPEVAVDLDVVYEQGNSTTRLRVYHHLGDDQVATLASADGVLWEAALLALREWPGELARVATPPNGTPPTSTGAGDTTAGVTLPYVLATVGCELIESGKQSLLPAIIDAHSGQTSRDGRALSDDETATVLNNLAAPAGRLRALITRMRQPRVDEHEESEAGQASRNTTGGRQRTPYDATPKAGVLSWILVDGGWRALRPRGSSADPRIFVTAENPGTLAPAISNVVAEVLT